MKKIILVLGGLCWLYSCGGTGGPGSDDFSTVYLTTSIEKTVINIDLVDLSVNQNNNQCLVIIPSGLDEQQNVNFIVSMKPNIPISAAPSDLVLYNFNLRLTPAVNNPEPFNRCFTGISIPTGVISVPMYQKTTNTVKLPVSVINQSIKECLVSNYGQIPASCDRMSFSFGPMYSVYALLSFTAREVYTGKEKRFNIDLGTFNLADFATSNTNSQFAKSSS